MSVADFLSNVGHGLATGARAVGAVAGPVVQSLAEEESGQAPEIQAEKRRQKMALQQASVASDVHDLQSQLDLGIKYGTLNDDEQNQYKKAIAQKYMDAISQAAAPGGNLIQRLHSAVHGGGAPYQPSTPTLANAVPEGGTAAMDAELMRKRLKPNYQPYKLEDGSIVNVDIDHYAPPDGGIPVGKQSLTQHRQLKTVVSKKLGGPVSASFDPQTGKLYDTSGAEITDATNYVKPTNPQMKAGTSQGKNVYAHFNTDLNSWVDSNTGLPIKDFRPMPTYAQTGNYGLDVAYDNEGTAHAVLMNRKTGQVTPAPAGLTAGSQGKNIEAVRNDAIAADTRLRVMLDNEREALKGNQQAMLSLVANHIGMTLGAQKGARINQAVWNEATESAPWMAAIGAKWSPDGYLQGVTLTPEQVRQMTDLGKSVRNIKWQQAQQTAQANGVAMNVPEFQEKPSATGASTTKVGDIIPKTGAAAAGTHTYAIDSNGKRRKVIDPNAQLPQGWKWAD